MKVRNNRGRNSVTFIFFERTTESKARKIRNFRGSQIRYLLYKNKLPGGGSKMPRFLNIIFKIGYSKSTIRRYKKKTGLDLPKYFYNTASSPPEFVMKPKNVLEFAAKSLEDYEEKFVDVIKEEYDDDRDIYNIREMTIVFFY